MTTDNDRFIPKFHQPKGYARPFRVKSREDSYRFVPWKKTPQHKFGLVSTCSICDRPVSLVKPDPKNPDVEVWVSCLETTWGYFHKDDRHHPVDCRQIIYTRHVDGTITEYKNPRHWGNTTTETSTNTEQEKQ